MTRGWQIVEVLQRVGITDRVVEVESLRGGVSSDIFRVDVGSRTVCVKFALDELRVASEWRAPAARSSVEYAWLTFIAAEFPRLVPSIIGADDANHAIVMEFLEPHDHPTWKSQLMAGQVDVTFATMVGSRLAEIHACSAATHGVAARFDNAANFAALRLDPYLRFTACRHPDLAHRIMMITDGLDKARIALVHGDISPKNILRGPVGPVFIDAECATFGDPAFDVAFCLNHLVIKSIVFPTARDRFEAAANALWTAWSAGIDWESPTAARSRVARLLPALMLARADGKSPLEYLTPETADTVRRAARAALLGEGTLPISIEERQL